MFLFVGAEKDLKKPIEIAKVEKIEAKISAILQSYYNKNKTKLKKLLKEITEKMLKLEEKVSGINILKRKRFTLVMVWPRPPCWSPVF